MNTYSLCLWMKRLQFISGEFMLNVLSGDEIKF
jgi:hypothetical protein